MYRYFFIATIYIHIYIRASNISIMAKDGEPVRQTGTLTGSQKVH